MSQDTDVTLWMKITETLVGDSISEYPECIVDKKTLPDLVYQLREVDAQSLVCSDEYGTLLHYAAGYSDDIGLFLALIHCGVDPNRKDINGKLAIEILNERRHTQFGENLEDPEDPTRPVHLHGYMSEHDNVIMAEWILAHITQV